MPKIYTKTVKSESRADVTYTLKIKDREVTCNCPGFTGYGYCKHSRAIKKDMAIVREFVQFAKSVKMTLNVSKQEAVKKAIKKVADPHLANDIRGYSKIVMDLV